MNIVPMLQAVHDMVVKATKGAIDMGYRHIDTAMIYDTEKAVGEAIRDKIEEGVITRDEIYVTTKVGLEFEGYFVANKLNFIISCIFFAFVQKTNLNIY